jgi:peptide/nickel transport system permease protein
MTQQIAASPTSYEPGIKRRSPLKRALTSSVSSTVSFIVIIFLVLVAFGASYLCSALGLGPLEANLFKRFEPASFSPFFTLGTDALGRDVLARLIMGAQTSMIVGVSAALLTSFIGCILGLIAGFYGGLTDRFLMRVSDIILALPLLPILIIVSAIDMGKLGIPQSLIEHSFFSLYKIVLMIALFAWPLSARLVRGATLSAKENLYVLAARSLGASRLRIMIRHILPNVIAPLIVATTLAVGNVIILEASLSFLGLGVQPPVASWGNMLQGAEDFIWDAPMLALWPGLAIFITVIAFNIAGDALRQAYNPKS